MNKTVVSQALLQLLVRVYNRSIQSYYFFPDVIICGHHRLERDDFEFLLKEGYIVPYHTDSFGKLYRLTKKAEEVLHTQLRVRKYRSQKAKEAAKQADFSFS